MIRALLTAALVAFAAPAKANETDWNFVLSNVAHILYHEAGHALIDAFQLPVIGQEEDAVDAFATLEIINGHSAAADMVLDVAEAYLIMFDEAAELEPPDYFGAHDLDIQRAYRMVCHAFGTDPDAFKDAADWIEMPKDRREDCQYEAELAADSWDALLDSTYRDDDTETVSIRLKIEEDQDFADIRAGIMSDTVVDDIRLYLEESFDWPEPLTLRIEACGEANAFYDPFDFSIIFCYEFAEELAYIDSLRPEAE